MVTAAFSNNAPGLHGGQEVIRKTVSSGSSGWQVMEDLAWFNAESTRCRPTLCPALC